MTRIQNKINALRHCTIRRARFYVSRVMRPTEALGTTTMRASTVIASVCTEPCRLLASTATTGSLMRTSEIAMRKSIDEMSKNTPYRWNHNLGTGIFDDYRSNAISAWFRDGKEYLFFKDPEAKKGWWCKYSIDLCKVSKRTSGGRTGTKGKCDDFSECMSRCREPKHSYLLRQDYWDCLGHSIEEFGALRHHISYTYLAICPSSVRALTAGADLLISLPLDTAAEVYFQEKFKGILSAEDYRFYAISVHHRNFINGKKRQRALGTSMRVESSSYEQFWLKQKDVLSLEVVLSGDISCGLLGLFLKRERVFLGLKQIMEYFISNFSLIVHCDQWLTHPSSLVPFLFQLPHYQS